MLFLFEAIDVLEVDMRVIRMFVSMVVTSVGLHLGQCRCMVVGIVCDGRHW